MTNEQYYWNVLRPQMLRGYIMAAGYADPIVQNKKKIRVEGEAIEGAELSHTKFEINGVEYDSSNYGKEFEFNAGNIMNVAVVGDSGSQVYKVNGVELSPMVPGRYDLEAFALTSDTVISVVYKQNWV